MMKMTSHVGNVYGLWIMDRSENKKRGEEREKEKTKTQTKKEIKTIALFKSNISQKIKQNE